MLQNGKLGRLYFVPLFFINKQTRTNGEISVANEKHRLTVPNYRFLETRNGRHVESGNDGHQRIKVTDVEALSGYFYPVFNYFDALLLLDILHIVRIRIFEKEDMS